VRRLLSDIVTSEPRYWIGYGDIVSVLININLAEIEPISCQGKEHTHMVLISFSLPCRSASGAKVVLASK
jgi:hypothetical protein